MPRFRGVLFDVDGTLIDSNRLHAHAWVDALHENGFDVPLDRVQRLIGMGGDKLLPEVTKLDKDDERSQQIEQRRGEIFKQVYLQQVEAQPASRALVKHLRDAGIELVVASSAKEEELKPLLKIAGAEDLLPKQTSSDDADESKPAPDIVQVALDKIKLTPGEVVMIGDTPYDIESASKAGVASIIVRCGGWRDEDLRGALAIYDDPADLLDHKDDLACYFGA